MNIEQFEKNFSQIVSDNKHLGCRKKRDKYTTTTKKKTHIKLFSQIKCATQSPADVHKYSIIANKEKHYCLEDFNIITSTFLFHINSFLSLMHCDCACDCVYGSKTVCVCV